MGCTVIGYSATPRTNGNSDIMMDEILRGAAEAGATTSKTKLHGLNIQPCRACDSCQKSVETPCVIQDDMPELLDAMLKADGIVLATPVYFFSASAQLKVFLDRTYALGGADTWDALRGKRLIAAFSYADSDAILSGVMNAIGMVRDCCSFLGIDLVGIVHASCSDPGEVRDQPQLLERAFTLGRKIAGA